MLYAAEELGLTEPAALLQWQLLDEQYQIKEEVAKDFDRFYTWYYINFVVDNAVKIPPDAPVSADNLDWNIMLSPIDISFPYTFVEVYPCSDEDRSGGSVPNISTIEKAKWWSVFIQGDTGELFSIAHCKNILVAHQFTVLINSLIVHWKRA